MFIIKIHSDDYYEKKNIKRTMALFFWQNFDYRKKAEFRFFEKIFLQFFLHFRFLERKFEGLMQRNGTEKRGLEKTFSF